MCITHRQREKPMPENVQGARTDLLAQAMRKVYAETFGDAVDPASDDAKPTDNETQQKNQRPTGSR